MYVSKYYSNVQTSRARVSKRVKNAGNKIESLFFKRGNYEINQNPHSDLDQVKYRTRKKKIAIKFMYKTSISKAELLVVATNKHRPIIKQSISNQSKWRIFSFCSVNLIFKPGKNVMCLDFKKLEKTKKKSSVRFLFIRCNDRPRTCSERIDLPRHAAATLASTHLQADQPRDGWRSPFTRHLRPVSDALRRQRLRDGTPTGFRVRRQTRDEAVYEVQHSS